MDILGKNTKTTAVVTACEHARLNRAAKQEVLNHPDMTSKLTEILSERTMDPVYEMHTQVDVL